MNKSYSEISNNFRNKVWTKMIIRKVFVKIRRMKILHKIIKNKFKIVNMFDFLI
jgi:hypothetical protein